MASVLDHKVLDEIHARDLEEVLVDAVHKLVQLVLVEVLVEVLGHESVTVLDLVVGFVGQSDRVVEAVH
eukprot:12929157-Prorocentrum_lima.AAC.1